jgi:hypothetical protein
MSAQLFKPVLPAVILTLVLGSLSPLQSHPFDETYTVSRSLFTLKEDYMEMRINFFINSYIKLYVKDAGTYDVFEAKLIKQREAGKGSMLTDLKKYVLSKVRVFVDKKALTGSISQLHLDFDTMEINKGRLRTVRVVGRYRIPENLKGSKYYIFNQLFDDSNNIHMGMGEIEVEDDVWSFNFGPKNYFSMPFRRLD